MPDLTLDLRYLKYAVQVAEAGSFRRAAERLSISQSTVSRRVQLFERQLGFSLFKRTRAGAGLTPEGERFLQQAVVGGATFVTPQRRSAPRGNSRPGS